MQTILINYGRQQITVVAEIEFFLRVYKIIYIQIYRYDLFEF